MTPQTQLGWRKLFLILTVLPCCWSLQVSIPEAVYEVANGGDITMTCSFIPARPISNTLILKWEAYPDNPEESIKAVATFFLNDPIDIAPAYENRAFLEVDTESLVSTLRLTKVSMQDTRRFQCSVTIPNDDEGTTAASTSLLVLVPPSPPICKIQGATEYWQDITLTCKSEEGSPKPTPEWKIFSVENVPMFPPKATQKDGVLSLFNISRETSGFYVCTSKNRIGESACNITLSVMPGSMNIGSTVGIIVGVLVGVVVIGIIIFCCCRQKGKKQENAEDAPGEAHYYRDAPETTEQYLDDKPHKTVKSNENEDRKGQKIEDDRRSYNSDKERNAVQDSDIGSQRDQQDHRGSRDRLDDRQNHGGSRDRLGDQRDRLIDQRDRHNGSRDRLDDRHDRHGGSRDRLDDRRDRHGGSRDRLDDWHDRHGGSRDRLDDRYGVDHGRAEDQRNRYGGSRDRLDDQHDHYGGSRDRLNDHRDHYRGSRDHIGYTEVYRH